MFEKDTETLLESHAHTRGQTALRQLRLAELCIIDKLSRLQEANANESLRRSRLYDPLYRKLFICDYSTNVVRLSLTHDGAAEELAKIDIEGDERVSAFTGFPVPRKRVYLDDFLFSALSSEGPDGITPLPTLQATATTDKDTDKDKDKRGELRQISNSVMNVNPTRRWIHLPHFGKSILLRLAARYSLHPLALQTVLEMRREASKIERYGRQYCISINVLQLDVSVSKENEDGANVEERDRRDKIAAASTHRGGVIQNALERAMGAEDEIPPEVRVHCSFTTIILGPGDEKDWMLNRGEHQDIGRMVDGGRSPGLGAPSSSMTTTTTARDFTWAITFETHQKTV